MEAARATPGPRDGQAASLSYSGAQLRSHRRRLGVGTQALADELGVTAAAVRYWEACPGVPADRRGAILEALAKLGRSAAREEKLRPAAVQLIRAWRRRAGWTQAELARELGVSQSAVSNWEQGVGLSLHRATEIVRLLRSVPAARPLPGGELRVARVRSGLTQRELAARLGVSVPTVRRWESERIAIPVHRRSAVRSLLGS